MAPRGGGVGSASMLGLDMHLGPQQMHPAAAFQHQQQGGFQLQQPAPVAVAVRQQQALPSFSPYSNTSSSRVAVGHDDDMVGNNGGGGKGGVVVPQQLASAACPWTRMKWTDAMVRLLIGVVYSVGDDGEGVATAGSAPGGKAGRAGSSGHGHGHAAAAQQQKKGKWKSVSHAMMDKGFVVSPQQCEDKFNDLNKRYKRVVDLLGRGRACRVVENHALLDTLDDLTPKAKEEARKLLNSKHLFFREMCTYHNNLLPHAGGGAAGDAACLHHPLPAPVAAAASSAARHAYAQQQAAAPSPPGMKYSSTDVADDDEDDDSDDAVSDNGDADEDDYDMYHSNNRPSRQHTTNKRGRGENGAAAEDLDDEAEGGCGRRARRRAAARVAPDPSAMLRQLKSELASGTAAAMDPQQARSWMHRRAVEVEEQQIRLDSHACYLDGQRLKWERFRGDKERDMERVRLQNDRLRMESRRLLLMLRHKDIELDMAEANSSSVDHHPGAGASPLAAHQQQQPIGSSPSPSTAGHPN
ncbi:unnamed protein product [Miscanthus lutarioriparius]|uniref:Myb/SANT-like DNA-binding domain-containing protein n=1 Tax=Miscanthus lutarioriparius TaxID=422564 RepID=A0A811P8C5_9POAL|nr:unnamed protein product [Miscanthus lutarioriparius]